MVYTATTRRVRAGVRERGAAAVLAMMFLVIFASLATAMAIVSHGNLRTADSHLRMTRAMAAADTGMKYTQFWLNRVIRENPATFATAKGEVDDVEAMGKWTDLCAALEEAIDAQVLPTGVANGLRIGPVAVAPNEQSWFIATLQPHPIEDTTGAPWEGHPLRGHAYLETPSQPTPFYDRQPYDASPPGENWEVDWRRKTGIYKPITQQQLDARYVRLVVQGIDGTVDDETGEIHPNAVTRTLSVDLRITKRLDMSIMSRSRLMVGRNVMIEGNIGSTFTDVHLDNGHPIQMVSDFRGLTDELDEALAQLADDLHTFDINGDNRLNIATEVDEADRDTMRDTYDLNGDGYVDDFDIFFKTFDGADGTEPDHRIGLGELVSGGVSNARAGQLIDLIDGFHPDFHENDEGVIDFRDRYAKLRGTASFQSTVEDWEQGAAGGNYHDYFEGAIDPKRGEMATRFGLENLGFVTDADNDGQPDPFQRSFGVKGYAELADADLGTQAAQQVGEDSDGDGNTAKIEQTAKPEAVPYQAAFPYDFYDRQVFRNMTFQNVRIPLGSNPLFINCTFKGVTYIETYAGNRITHPTDPDANAFNYSGMQNADGSPKHPDLDDDLELPAGVTSTKDLGNNIRFDGCRFLGPIVSGGPSGDRNEQPEAFSHTRNKLTFTSENGPTEFPDVNKLYEQGKIDKEEWELYRRGQIIAPHMSVEIGSYDPAAADQINLSGAVVAGVLDMRGNIEINGSIITTYEPKRDDGTVMGDTSPQFNTTIGYFDDSDGDLESDAPDADGDWGNIKIRYDPTLPLPDGILMTIRVEKLDSTYYEGTK